MAEKTKKKENKIITVIIGLFPGFIAGVVIISLLKWFLHDLSDALFILAAVCCIVTAVFALILGIAIHEAGHLIFGLMTGYKFSSYRIFSLIWIKDENNKIKFKRFKLAGTGGQCLMIPPDMKDGKIPFTLYNLGGVFANIIIGILFFILFLIFINIKLLALTMIIFSITNITFAMSNGIPMTASGVDNDAKNAISIKEDPEAMRAFWIQMKINEKVSKGIRLKDMPNEWFILPPKEKMENSMIAAIAVFSANRLIEEKRFEEADALMENIIDEDNATIMFYKQLLTCDRIYVELIRECRSDVIENMLDTNQKAFMKAMKNYPSIIRTEYAYELLLKKDEAKVNILIEQFETVAKKYPHKSEIEAERELINIAKSKSK